MLLEMLSHSLVSPFVMVSTDSIEAIIAFILSFASPIESW